MTLPALMLALLLSTAAGGTAEEAFQAGEEALRAGRSGIAEGHYRRALEMEPAHIRAILQLAKVVSWDDRLDESMEIYERALSVDPGNQRARLGLALVASWAGRFPRAISLYEGILREEAGHREATLGLARTASWAGDTARAMRLYRDLLKADPRDMEARNGLATALSWDGRLEEALALYEESLAQDPSDADALAGRARVLLWQGRSPQAWQAVGEAIQIHPGNREVLKLQEAVQDRFASNLRVRAGLMHDSDRNAIDTQQATFTFRPALPFSLALTYMRVDASQPCTRTDASAPCDHPASLGSNRMASRLESVKGQAGYRVRPDLVLSGSAGVDRIDRERAGSTTHGTASAGADYRLDDRWSFSASLSRETFAATALSMDRDVGLVAGTFTAAWAPASRVGTRLTFQRMETTDGNSRDLVAGFVRWAVPVQRPKVGLTWFGRYLSYDDPELGPEDGYFAPHFFLANIGGLEIGDRIASRIGWSVQGTLGLQQVRVLEDSPRNNDTVRGYYLRASYDVGARVTVEAYFGRTNLALAGPTGFKSTESGVRLRWKTGWPAPGIGTRP